MKARHISFLASLAFSCAVLHAAPALTAEDTNENALRDVATPAQQASLDSYNQACARAEKQRTEEIEKAREITEKNDKGMRRRIQSRLLDAMLPACERESALERE